MKGYIRIFILVWMLVFDVEENKYRFSGFLIFLKKVLDKLGYNGVKVNLKKYDKVLYDVGGKL